MTILDDLAARVPEVKAYLEALDFQLDYGGEYPALAAIAAFTACAEEFRRAESEAERAAIAEKYDIVLSLHNDEMHAAERLRTELAALKAEVERLRCCGNCGHMLTFELYFECALSPDAECNPYLNCHLTPSGWTAREDPK